MVFIEPLHSRGCLPSLGLWRWRRATRRAYRNASSWTPDLLKKQREQMRAAKEASRAEMEVTAEGELRLRGSAKDGAGGRILIRSERLRRRYASTVPKRPTPARSSTRVRTLFNNESDATDPSASSEPS